MAKKKKIQIPEFIDDNKEIIFDLMKERGISSITASFNGEGDSGQIDDIFVGLETESTTKSPFLNEPLEGMKISNGLRWSSTGPEVIYKEGPCKVRELIESVCYSILEQEYSGWENNDGGYGSFMFDSDVRTVALEMNTRYTEVSTESKVF